MAHCLSRLICSQGRKNTMVKYAETRVCLHTACQYLDPLQQRDFASCRHLCLSSLGPRSFLSMLHSFHHWSGAHTSLGPHSAYPERQGSVGTLNPGNVQPVPASRYHLKGHMKATKLKHMWQNMTEPITQRTWFLEGLGSVNAVHSESEMSADDSHTRPKALADTSSVTTCL